MKKIKKNILNALEYLRNNPNRSITETAKLFNIDRHTLSNYMNQDWLDKQFVENQQNLEDPYIYYFTNREISIIDYYRNHSNESYNNIKDKFPDAPDKRALRRWMDIFDYSYQTGQIIKYHYDRDKFQNIATEEDAYWLGFITADGCIIDKKWLSIKLQASDKIHLEKFCSYLGMDNTEIQEIIKNEVGGAYTKDNPVVSVKISSTKIVNNLIDKGITNRKSGKEVPYICSTIELEKAYIRGLIDGDGYLRSTQNGFGIVGSYDICNYVKSFINNNVVDVSTNSIVEHGTIKRFAVQGNKAFKIIQYFYKDSSIYLDRKYNLYLTKYIQ